VLDTGRYIALPMPSGRDIAPSGGYYYCSIAISAALVFNYGHIQIGVCKDWRTFWLSPGAGRAIPGSSFKGENG